MTTIPNLNPIPAVTGDDYLITHDITTNRSGRVSAEALKDYVSQSMVDGGDISSTAVPHEGSTVYTELNKAVKRVATFADLSSTVSVIGRPVYLVGHTVAGKGGGYFNTVSSSGRTPNNGTVAVNATLSIAFVRAHTGGNGVSVFDFGALGDGSDDSAAFNAANNSGEVVVCPVGDFTLANPVYLRQFKGSGRYVNQTHLILTGAGQLLPGDAYSTWSGFSVSTAVDSKIIIKNEGMSYFTCTDFLLYKTAGASQVGIHFDCTLADIYFNLIDNFSIVLDYPVKITGDMDGSPSVRAFNSNVLGRGVAGNKWFDFQSAITIDMGTGVCDANEFGGYFESGINIISLVSGSATPFKQNRVRVVQDAVTRIYNSSVAVPNQNIWELLDVGDFTWAGVRPQNQIFIGPPKTKVRATDTSSTPVMVNTTEVTMIFDSEVTDTLGEFVNTTGIFTPLDTGYYQIACSAITQSYTWPIGSKFELRLYKNSSIYSADKQISETASVANIPFTAKVSALVYLTPSDTVRIKLVHNRGADTSLDTEPTFNFINISRCGD